MELKINKACDLGSISVLPPRRTGGSSKGSGGMSASASAAAGPVASQQRSQTMSQQSFSQRCGGSGGASFSQGGGGGGASFSQGGSGGGGASLLHSQSQLSQASLDENLLSLHLPSPTRDQLSLQDDSSKRMPSFHASSASCVREESQLQLAKISSNRIHRWNPSLPDSRCQVPNEDVERKFQHLASSVHKMGMVLDSVQNDVMQLNRAMKEASLDSGSIQQKVVLLDNSLQQILKGQDDLKALLEGSTKCNPDQLSVLNSHTSKLNEISSILSVLPKQVQADLRQLKGDIFRIFTKEMEGIVRAIRSLSNRPAAMQMLADQSWTTNGKPLMNQTPVANGSPLMNQRPVANGRPQMKQIPLANGRPQLNQIPIANGRSQMNQIPEANRRPLMNQIPVTKVLHAPLPIKVEQGKVKAAAQKLVGSSYFRLSPKQEEVANPKVNPQVPTKAPVSIIIDSDDDSDGRASCVILKTETGAGAADLMKEEATSEEFLQILRRARKRRRREMQSVVVA